MIWLQQQQRAVQCDACCPVRVLAKPIACLSVREASQHLYLAGGEAMGSHCLAWLHARGAKRVPDARAALSCCARRSARKPRRCHKNAARGADQPGAWISSPPLQPLIARSSLPFRRWQQR